jgi:hypothetical protein
MAECPICLEEDAAFVSMTCKHEVCEVCLRKIMENSKECPLCRMDLRPPVQHVLQIQQAPPERVSCECLVIFFFMTAFVSLVFYGMAMHY